MKKHEPSRKEVNFLIRFAQGMGDRIQSFPRYDSFNPTESLPDPEREYLGLYFREYIQIGPLLRLSKSFTSPNKKLPNVKYFAEKILAPDNVIFYPSENTRMMWAKVSREVLQVILGLRKNKGVRQLRNEAIREHKLLPISQEEICKKLDLNEELRQTDPVLQKWRREFILKDRLFGYHAAFNHPKLRGRMKKIISTA